ncbi:SnoaL-like domain-containing protein [Aspergillus pseudodeflectus]|uniref:SnoaL-like domain-containing protein n=1 Tax=Aspergillus pseudodeflectus TaxID=176178 RepID=A0ABR4KV89_9EURO
MGSTDAVNVELLLQRLERLEGIHEIEKIMAHRAYLHSAGRHDREFDELWSKREDIVFEAEDWGAWTTRDSVYKAYVIGNPFPPSTPGLMIEHSVTTPVVEIAEDGETAKGVFISPGHETFPIDGVCHPNWSWGRYAVDFIKEEGKWKIWHLHVLTTFRTPFDQSWVTTALKKPAFLPEDGEVIEGVARPDRGVSFNQPYHPEKNPKYQPVPPEPFKTWTDTWSATDFYEHPAERTASK